MRGWAKVGKAVGSYHGVTDFSATDCIAISEGERQPGKGSGAHGEEECQGEGGSGD